MRSVVAVGATASNSVVVLHTVKAAHVAVSLVPVPSQVAE
jgi:hypothetical protein